MFIVLSLIYILALVLEDLLLPAIAGPELFLITPIFILAIIINTSNFKKALFEIILFGLIGELFKGAYLGSSIIPLIIAAFAYMALDHFIELRASLDGLASFTVIMGRSFILLCLVYVYSWFYIFLSSSYNVAASWDTWGVLLSLSAGVTIFIWSCIFSIIFAYVLKTK